MSFQRKNSLALKELHDKHAPGTELVNMKPKEEHSCSKEEPKCSKNEHQNPNGSYSKYTGTTSIQQLLKTTYSDSTQAHTPDMLNLSFPLTLEQQKQLKDDKYKFSHARTQRRNSTVYENVHRPTYARSMSVQSPRDKLRSNTNDSYDCKFECCGPYDILT